MRRKSASAPLLGVIAALLLCAAPARTQDQKPIDPRVLPPPPTEGAASAAPAPPHAEVALPAVIPATVVLRTGTSLPVVLDTPLSTRISKKGQLVNFRTEEPFAVEGGLALPPDTLFGGRVVEARRPGPFGRGGVLRVQVEHIAFPTGVSAPLVARLTSPELNRQGRGPSDKSRAAQLWNLASWSAQGALLGSRIDGLKGAGIGAGAGAAVVILMLMARRGGDVYLEPGTPFSILLQQPLTLVGADIAAAEREAAKGGASTASAGSAAAKAPATGVGAGREASPPQTEPHPKDPQR